MRCLRKSGWCRAGDAGMSANAVADKMGATLLVGAENVVRPPGNEVRPTPFGDSRVAVGSSGLMPPSLADRRIMLAFL